MNKVNLSIILCLATLCCCTNRVPAEERIENQIPIMAWDENNPGTLTAERYRVMKEAGITHNFVRGVDSLGQLLTGMDAAQAAGIKILAGCPELETEAEATVNRLKDHPALAGYHLRDEPNRNAFPELGEWIGKIRKTDSRHFCYVNLYPNYATSKQLAAKDYREYIQAYFREVPTEFLSFDHYPVRVYEGKRTVGEEWYENLEIVADECRKAGKRFWAFALTAAHYNFPVATLEDIRLQVYSNLAYGAQGIQYFNWMNVNPVFKTPPVEFTTGEKTAVYAHVQQVNREIKALSPVFLDASVVWVRHTGENIPQGTLRLDALPTPVQSFETAGQGAVVSLLEKDSHQYLVIVNRDINANLTVKTKMAAPVYKILKDGASVGASGIQTLDVAPGDVLIYGWKKN
jgi:hypothetical protein